MNNINNINNINIGIINKLYESEYEYKRIIKLLYYCKKGNLDSIISEKFTEKEILINNNNNYSESLRIACNYGNLDIVKYIIDIYIKKNLSPHIFIVYNGVILLEEMLHYSKFNNKNYKKIFKYFIEDLEDSRSIGINSLFNLSNIFYDSIILCKNISVSKYLIYRYILSFYNNIVYDNINIFEYDEFRLYSYIKNFFLKTPLKPFFKTLDLLDNFYTINKIHQLTYKLDCKVIDIYKYIRSIIFDWKLYLYYHSIKYKYVLNGILFKPNLGIEYYKQIKEFKTYPKF